MAYALQVELILARVGTERIGGYVAAAAGAEGVELPDPQQAWAEFDERLNAVPEPVDAERLELLQVLGVR